MAYRALILLHLLGVVAFFSNAIAALFWERRSAATRQPHVVAFAFQTLMTGDRRITPWSVAVVLVTGILGARAVGLSVLGTGWILWSLVTFGLSGLVFALRVLPLQRRLAKWSLPATSSSAFDWQGFEIERRRWEHWAHASLLLAFLALVLMVLKPALPALG